ncbi:hypothetical protein O181_029955 [Austropuccinia psidii MF-1]|uniref:Uncharacterized protein n=1 Tax=Austropuccinia psidii MF-1 TaxID=1389203 RepID=A0A9Q3H5Q1_9BASI|nr:hypothetical protein [Austropuccinia psidii MF-1]
MRRPLVHSLQCDWERLIRCIAEGIRILPLIPRKLSRFPTYPTFCSSQMTWVASSEKIYFLVLLSSFSTLYLLCFEKYSKRPLDVAEGNNELDLTLTLGQPKTSLRLPDTSAIGQVEAEVSPSPSCNQLYPGASNFSPPTANDGKSAVYLDPEVLEAAGFLNTHRTEACFGSCSQAIELAYDEPLHRTSEPIHELSNVAHTPFPESYQETALASSDGAQSSRLVKSNPETKKRKLMRISSSADSAKDNHVSPQIPPAYLVQQAHHSVPKIPHSFSLLFQESGGEINYYTQKRYAWLSALASISYMGRLCQKNSASHFALKTFFCQKGWMFETNSVYAYKASPLGIHGRLPLEKLATLWHQTSRLDLRFVSTFGRDCDIEKKEKGDESFQEFFVDKITQAERLLSPAHAQNTPENSENKELIHSLIANYLTEKEDPYLWKVLRPPPKKTTINIKKSDMLGTQIALNMIESYYRPRRETKWIYLFSERNQFLNFQVVLHYEYETGRFLTWRNSLFQRTKWPNFFPWEDNIETEGLSNKKLISQMGWYHDYIDKRVLPYSTVP